MRILNWNIVSFRSIIKKDNIIDNKKNKNNTFYNFINKKDIDIICLQELKLNDENLDLLDEYFINYNFKYVNIPNKKKGYSGVAIISRYQPIRMINRLIVNGNNDEEGRLLILEFNNFYLINVYFPNAGEQLKRLNYKNDFNKAIYKTLNRLKQKKEILLLGDFNAIQSPIDDFKYDLHYNKLAGVTQDEIDFLNKLINMGYNNVFRKFHKDKIQYSYFTYRYPARTRNHGMLLDYVLVTNKLLNKITKIKYLDNIFGSDHIPIQIDLDINLQ